MTVRSGTRLQDFYIQILLLSLPPRYPGSVGSIELKYAVGSIGQNRKQEPFCTAIHINIYTANWLSNC